MDKDVLLKKWLNNALTDAEKKAFEGHDDYKLNLKILEAAKQFRASQPDTSQDFKGFKKHYESKNKPVKTLNWFTPALRIAAALIVGLGIYFFAFSNTTTSYETLAKQKEHVELPDHSKVTLNALSQIAFDTDNWEQKRAVQLQGEAYFKVQKGSTFNVITEAGTVTVVGTEFNVKQRPDYFEVKCFEGVVKVASGTIERTLHAGDTYQILNGIFVQDKTTLIVPQWTKDISRFSEVPLWAVFGELERQFDIKITFKSIKSARKFSGGFKHNNLKEALISITKPMGLTFEVSSSNDVVIHENTN